jgi:uncharacterized protein
MSITERVSETVRAALQKVDASHDFAHIVRVRNMAMRLAPELGITDATSLEVIELAALLHDIGDWKYTGSETAGVERARHVLDSESYAHDLTDRVIEIISKVGFKDELGRSPNASALALECAIVQDADRLDAIGAIGIARCMIFTGAKGRPLHNPESKPLENMTKEQYMQRSASAADNTAINHFYEKLLRLKDMMKTEPAKKIAEERHEYMLGYLERFYREWNGDA